MLRKTLLSNGLPFFALCLCIALTVCGCSAQSNTTFPKGFVHFKGFVPDVTYDIRYAGKHNFLGRPVAGYKSAEAILSVEAATALKAAQKELDPLGLGFKVFDAYRPQRAVNDFVAWAKVLSDTTAKREFYPDVPKSELFKRGYIASRSGHTRGSTLDLTLYNVKTGKELDMGGPYDFFGTVSHEDAKGLTPAQQKNRDLLRNVLEKHGFRAYDKEWWHFTLNKEPYPDTYFDFPVE